MTFGYLDTGSWKLRVATRHQAQYRNKMIFSLAWMHELGLSGLHESDIMMLTSSLNPEKGEVEGSTCREKKVYSVEFSYLPE